MSRGRRQLALTGLGEAVAAWLSTSPMSGPMVLAVLGGAVAGLGQAPFDWPSLGLLGLVAAFVLMRAAATPLCAAWVGFAFGAGYFLLTLHWIYAPFLVEADRHGWMAPFAVLFLACGMALLWVPAFWLARACACGLPPMPRPRAGL